MRLTVSSEVSAEEKKALNRISRTKEQQGKNQFAGVHGRFVIFSLRARPMAHHFLLYSW